MNAFCKMFAVSTIALTMAGSSAAVAQDHHDDHHDQYVRHEEWKKGSRIRHEDWDRAQHVEDWHAHHLRRPPAGYEWRYVDGNYVLARNDGLIFSVVVGH